MEILFPDRGPLNYKTFVAVQQELQTYPSGKHEYHATCYTYSEETAINIPAYLCCCPCPKYLYSHLQMILEVVKLLSVLKIGTML